MTWPRVTRKQGPIFVSSSSDTTEAEGEVSAPPSDFSALDAGLLQPRNISALDSVFAVGRLLLGVCVCVLVRGQARTRGPAF